jgi:hypothetical protein
LRQDHLLALVQIGGLTEKFPIVTDTLSIEQDSTSDGFVMLTRLWRNTGEGQPSLED